VVFLSGVFKGLLDGFVIRVGLRTGGKGSCGRLNELVAGVIDEFLHIGLYF